MTARLSHVRPTSLASAGEGPGQPPLAQAAEGLTVLRQQYSGDVATQSMLGAAVKELSLSAKMCESFLKRMRGDTGGLVT